MKDALQDVLGTQNFTLTYSDKGELRTIALRGSQQEGGPAGQSPDETAITDKNRAPAGETAVFKSFDLLSEIPI